MWINKTAYTAWVEQMRRLEAWAVGLGQTLAEKDAQIKHLTGRLLELQQVHLELIRSEATKAAYLDVWRMRVNELTEERNKLFNNIVPGINLTTPRVEHTPFVMAPGADFEDMGDAAAAMMGLADELPAGAVKGRPGMRQLDDLEERLQDPTRIVDE